MEKDDLITSIYRRSEFDEQIQKEFEKATYDYPLSFVILDIDHFKNVNDDYGHQQGDLILVKIGEIINQITNDKGYAFRYGGEELSILLPNFSLNEARAVAERIRTTIEEYQFANIEEEKESLNCTVSIGISSCPNETIQDKEELIKRADDAMYKAKNDGRNRVYIDKPNNMVEKKKQLPALDVEFLLDESRCYVLRDINHLFLLLQLKFINRGSQPTNAQINIIEVLVNDIWKTAERSSRPIGSTIKERRASINLHSIATLKPYEDIRLESKDAKTEYIAFLLKEEVSNDLEYIEIRGKVEDFDGRIAKFTETIQRYR